MQFTPGVSEDTKAIFDLYDKAVEFQKTKSDKHCLLQSSMVSATKPSSSRLSQTLRK